LRPTPDRVRETLFNWLGQDLTGRRCLDVFAGSGALGIEAASRGAAEVIMLEKNRLVFHTLQENIRKLNLQQIIARNDDGLSFVKRDMEPFDVIFLDPPFKSDALIKILPLLPALLKPEGFLYIESGSRVEIAEPWQVIKSAKAGAVHYQLMQYGQHD
jgi:16S rRNA (guanine(966)-N(2))-methyltransferase RsmD